MIYPKNFESKIGFDEVRTMLRERCLCGLGRDMVDLVSMSADVHTVAEWLLQVAELRRILDSCEAFPLAHFIDVRQSVGRLRLEGTHLEEQELFDLRRSLDTIAGIVRFLGSGAEEANDGTTVRPYPALYRLSDGVATYPQLIRRIDEVLDKFGHLRDDASPELMRIRRELAHTEGSISRTLQGILRSAQVDGLVDRDASPTIRDGRLVIPVAPGLKRRIRGIVHDESASGKTVYIEPAEVVEANNRVRELEAEERREIVRILVSVANDLRPHTAGMLDSYDFLAKIDLIRAKAVLAEYMGAVVPCVEQRPLIDWTMAVHPLLAISLAKQSKAVVPLDITLTAEKRLLIISGPNAGGKSVCLKTAGLLQYMLQCGLPIPVSERSKAGIFTGIMIDIGDEQSIENDLSTYSSHLTNMKNMMRQANDSTLLLIDEFGGGTEPTIGGAIAEAVLKQFCNRGAYGIITTHYQNLKRFADSHDGVANGAMLYDRREMRPLYRLAIGQPGSSFAIEIARQTGLPEVVIRDASEIVGFDYIQSDKYLQDIVRDKRYWENKRQTIHQREKSLEQKIARYEAELAELEQSRKDILRRAKEQAEELLRESNRRIENTIREIREQQAEREETKRIREELAAFKDEVATIDTKATDELVAKKMRQITERKERREKRRRERAEEARREGDAQSAGQPIREPRVAAEPLREGDTVRIKGLTSIGRIEHIDGKMATVIFGDMRTKMRADRLERAQKPNEAASPSVAASYSRLTRETIDSHRQNFKQDIDVRGMRGDEALTAVTHFIDDAILVGMERVRILHGTGNGILRQLIRQYLATVPNVKSFRDEHVQFGGAGITVVEL